jgi:hypothetical protein
VRQRCPTHDMPDCSPMLNGCSWRPAQSELAWRLAMEAHAGQLDKVGQPYIGHPGRVAVAVVSEGHSDEVEAVAWLHDVVEDCPVTLDDLRMHGFTEEVVEAVDAISKRRGERLETYYERVKANPIALVVKQHDVADNADPARLALVAPDTRDRLRAKYERARSILLETSKGLQGSGNPADEGSDPRG